MPSVVQQSRTIGVHGASAVVVLLVACALASPARAAEEAMPLQPATRLSAQLAVGQHRRYRLALAAGQTVVLSIRQNDAMLHLRWARAGTPLSPPLLTQAGRQAMLEWHLQADVASEWDIDVAAAKADRSAAYRLELGRAHATSAVDRDRFAAERELVSAEAIRVAAGGVEPGRQPADVDSARSQYREAGARWRKAGAPCSALRAEVGLARLELALARYPQAQAAAQAALVGCADFDDLAIAADRAAALRTLAAALGYQGDFEASAADSERALALYRRTGDRRFEGVVLGNLSAVYRSLGETQKAMDSAQAALDIALATGDAQGVEFSRDNLADSHLARGEFGRALAIYRQTLEDLRRTPYPLAEGLVWNELGTLYRRMGETDDARAAWAHARDVWAASGNRSGMAETWISVGDAALDESASASAAAAFTRALDIARTDHLQSPEVHALRGLGRVAAANADPVAARAHLHASLDLARGLGDSAGEMAAEQALGDVEAAASSWRDARVRYAHVLAVATRAGDASAQAAADASLARVDVAEGLLDTAQARIERALAIVESQRAGIADPGLRTGFFASQHEYYALAIDIEMALALRVPGMGHCEHALEMAERARARSLQDMLAERAIGIDAEVAPALLAAERGAADTQRRLAYRLARNAAPATAPARLQREIEQAGRELDAARGRIRAASPRYAEIAHPPPLHVADIRAGLLDADTAILEYWLGESKSYLWVVDRASVRGFELPSRATIAQASRMLRERVIAHAHEDASVPIERRVALDAGERALTLQRATALADMALPRAARAQAPRQWAVVADAELQDVPFALLAAATLGDAAPLLVQLPSIGALRGLRALPRVSTTAMAVAIVADPVFDRDDPRLVQRPRSAMSEPALQGAAGEAGVRSLPRLPQARAEAQDIAALARGRPSRSLLGFAANREAVLQTDWSDYAVVHFATHALLNARHPDLSGIVLSLYDGDGRATDGFLRINDLYALSMPSDLVVLGVCDSAQGRQLGGEGVLSLARAFFHAGTRHVVASLWPVDDRASAVFMHTFYGALLQDKLRPQQALARAQAQMRENPRWNAAYYWSGFVVQGDWR
jgi:CHAT domain-containing protein/tetratricopeptide (TPR) repeat protein